MSQLVEISKHRCEMLKKNPVFFLKFYENIRDNGYGEEQDLSTWRSLDRDLNIIFGAGNFADRVLGYALCVVDGTEPKKDDKGNIVPDVVKVSIHSASSNNVNDWMKIINCFVLRSQNREDNYAFMELLWALDKLEWNGKTLISALSKYPVQVIPFLIANFQRIGRILSYYKQQTLKEVCELYNGQYIIYSPVIIKEAFDCVSNALDSDKIKDYKSLNLFEIIDVIFRQEEFPDVIESFDETNPLLRINTWFYGERSLNDYNSLSRVFPLLSEEFRLRLVKRYFHDFRNDSALLDLTFLQRLKENKYDEFIRYRYCVESPNEPVVLTVPLLIDTLITLYNTKGHSFQTFDGILDFAMTYCDRVHPTIDFKLDRFIPTCNRGAVYNGESFKGFIDYALVRKLNVNMMTVEHLRKTFIYLMDKYAIRKTYPACKYGDGSIIPEEVFKYCSKKNIGEYSWSLECFHHLPYEDRWIIKHEYLENIKHLLIEENISYSPEYTVSLDMLSLDKLKDYIFSLPHKFEELYEGEFLIHSYDRDAVSKNFDLYLIQEYSDILRMRIFPQDGALVGLQFDVFGYWKEIVKSLPGGSLCNRNSEQYENAYSQYVSLESQEVKRRCVESLRKELNSELLNSSYFEIPYDRTLLSNTIKRFYHKESFKENDQIYKHEFLTQLRINSNFVQYCAPQLSEEKNPAISLPYFWCRGKECFKNNLETQALEKESNWENYSLFHMAEIMGFPMLHRTEAGYEPEQSVWQFIAVINKVMQKFRHLKCRECGHMMFTDKSSGFNRYNYYACANPICSEVSNVVYLNFCFKCKKGLIDSRDTKQCPNGWYICPTCLACCDDEQYERQAQRYILIKKTIPTRIQEKRGQGHNDKGEYFCPQCGELIVDKIDEQGYNHRVCQGCGTSFS